MSAIFISHSSRDNPIAGEVRARLAELGHRSVFLDFDPADGIPAGRDWEKELYARLRGCRAVIVLCSEHSMASDWCFAEITHARSLGKAIFPLKVGPCTLRSVLTGVQTIDLTRDRDDGYQRLGRGLLAAGVDPRDVFDWDGRRPPYPGLTAFQEADAAVFFGRDAEICDGLDLLHRLRSFGGAWLALVLGASGSGKSSLVRAGVLPRLRRDEDHWLVARPFRPLRQPFKELALALSELCARHGASRPREALLEALRGDAERPEPGVLQGLVESLRIASGRRDAMLLLSIDQCEELLDGEGAERADLFLPWLRASAQSPHRPILVLGTLRSDFLGDFQDHPALSEMPFASLPLGPLSEEGFCQVIEGPARVAGVELEPGLVQAMVSESTTLDALPLLAFTLRELYERHGAREARLEIRDYRDMGGLEGSVAVAAEAVMAAQRLSRDELEDLRSAFVSMVRINDEGRYVRRTVRWRHLPERSHAVLERFVAARLLVSRSDGEERVVEVAHEALFRVWRDLERWLAEDRESIRLRDGIKRAAQEWEAGDREPQLLVHRGARLEAAEALARQPRFELDEPAGDYLAACVEVREAQRRAEQRAAEARRRRLQAVIASLAAGLAIVSLLGAWALKQRHQALEKSRVAVSLRLAAEAATRAGGQIDHQLLLAAEAYRRDPSARARRSLLDGLAASPRLITFLNGNQSRVWGAAFSGDGTRLAASGDQGTVVLWDVASRERAGEPYAAGGAPLWGLAMSRDGTRVAAGGNDGRVLTWEVASGARTEIARHRGKVFRVAFSPDGSRLATASPDGVHLWNVATGTPVREPLAGPSEKAWGLAFSPDGDLLAVGSHLAGAEPGPDAAWDFGAAEPGTVTLWDLAAGRPAWGPQTAHEKVVTSVAFHPDGTLLAAASEDGTVSLWDVASGERAGTLPGRHDSAWSVAFSPDGARLAVSGEDDGRIVVWRLAAADIGAARVEHELRGPPGSIWSVAFHPGGDLLASTFEAGEGGVVLWDVAADGPPPERALAQGRAASLAVSPDGTLVAAGDPEDGSILLWDVARRRTLGAAGTIWTAAPTDRREPLIRRRDLGSEPVGHPVAGPAGKVWSVAFSPDGRQLAWTAGSSTVYLRDLTSGAPVREIATDHDGAVWAVAFRPGGHQLATGGRDRTLRLWDLATGAAVGEPMIGQDQAWVRSLAFSPDGTMLAAGDRFGAIVVWDVAAGRSLGEPLRGHDWEVDCVALAISGDGTYLAAGYEDGAAVLWDLPTGTALSKQVFSGGAIYGAAFRADGARLALTRDDGAVFLWDVDPASWLERACGKVRRNLTCREWDRFIGDEPYRATCPEHPADDCGV